jgi:hypothetical protein
MSDFPYSLEQQREILRAYEETERPANGKPPATPRAAPPRRLPPYRQFPSGLLPAVLRDFVRAHAKSKACDPALVALPALAACAGAIGNSYVIRPKWDWVEPCVLWLPTVAESGDLKSPPFKAAVGPVARMQMTSDREHEAEAAAWGSLDKKEQQAQRKLGQAPGPQRSFYVTDATVQAVALALKDHPKGCLLAAGELRTWFESFTRFAAGGASDQPHWLEMHDAGDVRKIRVAGERKIISVPNAAVSITGTIQPGIFARACTRENAESGLLARLWPAMPPAPVQEWVESEEPKQQVADYRQLLETLLAQPYDPANFCGTLTFSEEAQELFVKWVNGWAARRNLAGPEERPLLAKLKGGAARLALLWQVVTCLAKRETSAALEKFEVSGYAVEAGTKLAEWFAYESWRVYQSFRETPQERERRQLMEWLEGRGGAATARELMDGRRATYPTSEDAEAALNGLRRDGWGDWHERPPGPSGGRPTFVFRLNAYPETSNSQQKSGVSGFAGAGDEYQTDDDAEGVGNP